jgi:hypothetical protein
MLDGLGFRFRWATEGLREGDWEFRPGPDSMSIGEIAGHVWGLVNWIGMSVFEGRSHERPSGHAAVREHALRIIESLRVEFARLGEESLLALRADRDQPFWNLLNGPIADALTHTGQINSFRRLAGNPPVEANVFLGLPPDGP